MSTPTTTRPSTRFGGLDGLRAVAVVMVLVYHLFPRALPGGFLGVDLFFTISGFLITSLLLRELQASGRIDFLAFWRRRARRLLPPLVLVVLLSTTLALAVDRDLLVGIGRQIAGAMFFVSNWVFIANGTDYFAQDAPELFRNTWSLALEEQFYIVLPLVALILFRMKSRTSRVLPLAALGLISAWLMVQFALDGVNATRIYFGSDSHSFGLLFGAAMATLVQRTDPRPIGRGGQALSIAVAAAGLAVIVWLFLTLPEASEASFTGGFQLATLAGLAIVWAVTRRGAWAGRALDVQPLRWIGERSYGIYLWHWPLALILTTLAAHFGSGFPVWIAPVATAALTIALATLSYRYVEQPVRKLGLRRAFRLWFTPRSYTPRRRTVSIALAAVLAVTFPLSGLAVAVAPDQTTSAETIARGKAALDAAKRGADPASPGGDPEQGADGSDEPQGSDTSKGDADAKGGGDSKSAEDSKSGGGSKGTADAKGGSAPPEPVSVEGRDITAVGDSVMLASYPELIDHFPDIYVDAAVSRGLNAGVDILSGLSSAGQLRSVIVVGLGTNGPVDRDELEALRQIAGPRPIVLVNAHGERDWIPPVNAELQAFADSYRGVVVAHWDEDVTGVADALAGDGIHPNPSGGDIYAQAVQDALDELNGPREAVGWGVPRR